MAKRQFLKDLQEGDEVDDVFSIRYKKPPREYSKGYMFEVRLSDRSGNMNLKFWGPNDERLVDKIFEPLVSGGVVRVKGRVSSYKDSLEISVGEDDGIALAERSEYDIRDFVPTTERDVDQMMSRLNSFIRQVQDPFLSKLLRHFFANEEFVIRFKEAPASIQKHSNCIGGLLEHTLSVVEICAMVHSLKPKMDKDLLLTGAILHDIGKMNEYRITTNIDMSEEGMLLGHIFIGAEKLKEAIDGIDDFPPTLGFKLVHIVLSSHGRLEFGSPRLPQFAEAAAIHYADEMDAKVEQYIRVKEEARTEDDWTFDSDLRHIFLR
jgi:3'-5' exoribonuclease